MLKVTTSWDDGDILDKRLSSLLEHYDIKGTFYISKNYRKERMPEEDIKNINKFHEIGAHTMTHPDLRALTPLEQEKETEESKEWLEKVLGTEVKMFCYPKGLYNTSAVSVVKDAGFLGARTTKLGEITLLSDPYLIDTTIQVYPFPFRKLDKKKYYLRKLLQPYTQRAPSLRVLGVSTFLMYSWLSTAKATFNTALKNGEIFHLWGHSWEIDKYDMWDELEKFLQYISNRKNCIYLTNSELLS